MNSKKSVKSVKDTRSKQSIVESSKSTLQKFMRIASESSRKSSVISPSKSSVISPKEATVRKNFGISLEEYEKLANSNPQKLFELNEKMLLKK